MTAEKAATERTTDHWAWLELHPVEPPQCDSESPLRLGCGLVRDQRLRPRHLCWRLEETAGLFPRVELPCPREPCVVPTWLFVTPQATGSSPLPLGVSQAEPASAFLPGSCSIPHYLSWGLKVEWDHLGLRRKQDRGLDWRAKD